MPSSNGGQPTLVETSTELSTARSTARAVLEDWFVDNGVPFFKDGHRVRDTEVALDYAVVVCLACQVLLVARLSDANATRLLVAPLCVVMVVLAARLAAGRMIRNASAVALIGALIVTYLGPPWLDLGVLLFAATSARLLVRPDGANVRDLSRVSVLALVGLLALGATSCAFEPVAIPGSVEVLEDLTGASTSHAQATSTAVPALAVALLILCIALRADRTRTSPYRGPLTSVLPVLPPAIVAVAAQATFVSHVDSAAAEALLALSLLAAAALLLIKRARVDKAVSRCGSKATSLISGEPDADRRPRRTLQLRIALYLLSGLSIAFLLHRSGFLGPSPGVILSVGVAAAVSIFYLALGRMVVWFGLDRIVAWGMTSVARDSWRTMSGLVRGLPFLLVFATFFVLTAELWQVLTRAENVTFIAIAGGLVLFFSVFLVLTAHREIISEASFATRRDVQEASVSIGPDANPGPLSGEQVRYLLDRAPGATDDGIRGHGLGKMRRVNAILVVIVYESLLLVPLAAISGVLFYWFSKLAVPASVAAEWAYGDGPTDAQIHEVDARGLLTEPWFRVAIVLTMFSLLYMAVTVIADPKKRKDFFSAADRELRQRLALELVYRTAIVDPEPRPPGDEVPAGENGAGEAGAGEPGAPTTLPA